MIRSIHGPQVPVESGRCVRLMKAGPGQEHPRAAVKRDIPRNISFGFGPCKRSMGRSFETCRRWRTAAA
jgi:hypothetical protein